MLEVKLHPAAAVGSDEHTVDWTHMFGPQDIRMHMCELQSLRNSGSINPALWKWVQYKINFSAY